MTDITTAEYDLLDRALDSAGRELHAGGDIDTLTMLFLDSISRDRQNEVLRFLMAETIGLLVARCCLLDETDGNSYATEHEASAILTDAIITQGRQLTACRELASDLIQRRAEYDAIMADPRNQPQPYEPGRHPFDDAWLPSEAVASATGYYDKPEQG